MVPARGKLTDWMGRTSLLGGRWHRVTGASGWQAVQADDRNSRDLRIFCLTGIIGKLECDDFAESKPAPSLPGRFLRRLESIPHVSELSCFQEPEETPIVSRPMLETSFATWFICLVFIWIFAKDAY